MMHQTPWFAPALKPTAIISTPLVIAPMLGMKASTPVTRPSRPAIGTPPSVSMNQVNTPSKIIADQPAEQQPAKREADMLGDAVEAGAMPQRQHPGDAAVVDPGLGREEDADDDHRDDARHARR